MSVITEMSDYLTSMASYDADYWPQNTHDALKLLQSQSINIRAPSDVIPDSAADFWKLIDTLPRLFAACDTLELLSEAIDKAGDDRVKRAWSRATSCKLPALSNWSGRTLPDWLRLFNYPTLNAVFGESEINGLLTSSTKQIWLAPEESSNGFAYRTPLGPFGVCSTMPGSKTVPGARTEVVYGLPYGRSSHPNNHQMSSLADWDSLSKPALDMLRQRHPLPFRLSPHSDKNDDAPLFPAIVYTAQASENDMAKAEIRAAAAAAKALQVLENLMLTSGCMSSSPVVAIIVSAGSLWRVHFATSTVVDGDIDKPSYDIYRSRKLDLYIDDLGDRVRLNVILANLERWLRITHANWVRRHTAALWTSYLAENVGASTAEGSGDNDGTTEELYVEDSEAATSGTGSSEADDWMGQDWRVGPGETEDWVTQARLASMGPNMPAGIV